MYYENVKGVLSSGFGMLYGCRPLQPELISAGIRCGPMNGFRRTCRSSIPIWGLASKCPIPHWIAGSKSGVWGV